jgi:ApbE superfamily uncharacterized protein (UPF0280 family)
MSSEGDGAEVLMYYFEERGYRKRVGGGLRSFRVTVGETDLFIRADKDLKGMVEGMVRKVRAELEGYIAMDPWFALSLSPYPVSPFAPGIVRDMAEASALAGVGPMAAVAGAIAEHIGRGLMEVCEDVIVENGGDLFIRCSVPIVVAILAGNSPISGRIGILVDPSDEPVGICTSSGTVGHSLSFGKADAATVVSNSAAIADAAATAVGNVVVDEGDIEAGLLLASSIKGVRGAVVVKGGRVGIWGELKLIPVSSPRSWFDST